MRFERQRGQVSVELVAALPALIVAALVAAQLALAGYALWSAGGAARAGARAGYVGGDARRAALSALPGALRDGAEVHEGDGVEVQVRTPSVVPGLPRIPVDARADLGAGGG
jgi:hypothetical protein